MSARRTERRGDLRAQIAANRRGCERLAALARKYGTETLKRIMQEVMDYSEAMMRALLREIPDGEGSFEDFCDGDGIVAPRARTGTRPSTSGMRDHQARATA